jgi:hypothetical protein
VRPRPKVTKVVCMTKIAAPKRRRKRFRKDVLAFRRSEIVRDACEVGAADTADFDRWLIQWAVHNPGAKDEIWAVMMAAQKMGGEITEEEAAGICDEAALYTHLPTADQLAKTLGLTYDRRRKLRITTIGAIDIDKRGREEIRRVRAKVKQEARRRAKGVRPRAEYEANSQSAKWRKLGMSKATFYRKNMHRTKDETGPYTASLLTAKDTPVSLERQGWPSEASPLRKEERGLASSQTATTLAADIHVRVPNWCFGRKPAAELRVAA